MYGLKKESILAYKQLVKHLKIHEYYLVIGTNAIYPHKTRKTRFCLCVDDFGINITQQTILTTYVINSEKNTQLPLIGKGNICGLIFYWNYEAGYVDMEMTCYVPNALDRLKHTPIV